MVAVRAFRAAWNLLSSALRNAAREPGHLVPWRVLVVALAAGLLTDPPLSPLPVAAVLVVLVLTAGEGVLRRLVVPPVAAGLPGYADAARSGTAALLGRAGLVLPLVFVVLAVTGAPGWCWLVACLVHVVLAALVVAQGVRLYATRGARDRRLRAAVRDLAPEFLLYSARRGGAYQLQMWLPYLQSLGRPFAVVTREAQGLQDWAEEAGVPVIARSRWRELDDVMVPTVRAVFYVNSLSANSDLVTYRQATHVYLGHGESDKSLSHHPAHAMYDRIFISGEAAVDRYRANGVVIPPEKFVVVGRPQTRDIEPVGPRRAEGEPFRVLYAPTWEGYNSGSSYSSLSRGKAIVQVLLDVGCTVVFRPHPFSFERPSELPWVREVEDLLASDRAGGRPHRVERSGSFADSANASDALLADLSSVVTDYLASGKPLAIVAPDASRADLVRTSPVTEAAYLVGADGTGLEDALAQMAGPDPLAERREAVRLRYIGTPIGEPADAAFVRAAGALLEGGRESLPPTATAAGSPS